MNNQAIAFHAATKPFSFIDAHNRRALATGGNPAAGYTADYNGHRVTVRWNSYRGHYVGSYRWDGEKRIARGSLAAVISACLAFHKRQGRGASLSVHVRAEDVEAVAPFVEAGDLIETTEDTAAADLAWYTWRHTFAANCAPDYARPFAFRYLFDADLLAAAENQREYLALVEAKHGRRTA